ncbi:MAG: hypothetical protein MMC23_003737 [Stictis urceolatum]|nr:hypothetical protein [Stictis urceolata]
MANIDSILGDDLAAISKLYEIDPEFENALKAMEPIPSPDFKDVAAVRANGLATEEKSAPPLPDDSTILDSTRTIPMRDGHLTGAIVVSPKAIPANGSPLVVLYFGGGFMMGTPKQQLPLARVLAKRYDAVAFSGISFSQAQYDGWDALQWAAAHAVELNAEPIRGFVVAGISAGATVAGIAAHAAKDEGLSPSLTGMSLSIPWGVDREALPKKYKAHFISVEQCKEAPMFNEKFVQVIINAHKPDKKSP